MSATVSTVPALYGVMAEFVTGDELIVATQKAKEAGYEVLLNTDKNIRYQQNLTSRRIALVVLGNQQWEPLLEIALLIVCNLG